MPERKAGRLSMRLLLLAVAAAVAVAGLFAVLLWREGQTAKGESDLKARLNDPATQIPTIREMAQEGISYLDAHLQSEDRVIHNSAILAYGERKGDAEATRRLVSLCRGADAEDAHWALIALASQAAEEAKGLIQDSARAEAPRLREAACIAIGRCRDESLRPLLDQLAEDPDSTVRGAARSVLRRMRGGHGGSGAPAPHP